MLAVSTLDVAPIEIEPQVEIQPRWSLATRTAFRFCFTYFTLYVVCTQMLGGLIVVPGFDVPDLSSTKAMERIVTWAGTHVFHIGYPYSFTDTGSGDKTVDYGKVMEVMGLLNAAGITRIGLVTDSLRTPSPQ